MSREKENHYGIIPSRHEPYSHWRDSFSHANMMYICSTFWHVHSHIKTSSQLAPHGRKEAQTLFITSLEMPVLNFIPVSVLIALFSPALHFADSYTEIICTDKVHKNLSIFLHPASVSCPSICLTAWSKEGRRDKKKEHFHSFPTLAHQIHSTQAYFPHSGGCYRRTANSRPAWAGKWSGFILRLGTVAHIYNSSTKEAEAEVTWIQVQPERKWENPSQNNNKGKDMVAHISCANTAEASESLWILSKPLLHS